MKKVLLLLCQGFEEYEASVFTDVLGWSRSYGLESVTVETVGLRSEVQGAFNMLVRPQRQIAEINAAEYAALAIPGGFEARGFYEDAYDERVQRLIQSFDQAEKLISSVCVAALALGKSGVLKARHATTYHHNEGMRRKQLKEFGVTVIDQHLVIDRNIITCSCPAVAIDVAFLTLRKLTSEANELKIREYMGFINRPNKALVPTPASVTPAAGAPVAPDAGAAHL
jgi:4-methyl-5(b-hydroxyethyl)-thiazole monophosphate biosynthesis